MLALGYLVLLTLALRCTAAPTEKDWCSPPSREAEVEPQGTLEDESYPPGKVLTFVCRPGYSRLGTIKRVCAEGKWVNIGNGKCQRKSCGHPGDIDFGSFTLIEGDGFVFGAKVQYSCDEGYQMVSKQTARECTASGWSHHTPYCEVKKCGPVTSTSTVNVISTSYDDAEYSVGQVVRFECKNPKLKLEGVSEIFCTSEGVWSGNKPECKEVSCEPPEISNGRVNGDKKVYVENDVLPFRCNPKYKPSKSGDVHCTINGWNPHPYCEEISCYPDYVANGNVEKKKDVYKEGDTIKLVCNYGYRIETSPDEPRTCTKNGWSPPLKCISLTCDNPRIDNGELYYNYYFPRAINSEIVYRCNNGYLAPNKETYGKSQCTDSGWSPRLKCTRSCSRSDAEVTNGRLEKSDRYYLSGEKVAFTCYQNYYTPDGKSQGERECLPDGRFTDAKCSRYCVVKPLNNGQYVPKNEVFEVGQYLQITCNNGFMTRKNTLIENIQCLREGWEIPPECIEVTCSVDSGLSSRKRQYKAGEVAEFSCQRGYILSGDSSSQCYYFGWGPPLPTCKAVRCRVQDNILVSDRKEYTAGEEVRFSCGKGYRLIGQSNVRCNENGWSPKQPYCEVDRCVVNDVRLNPHQKEYQLNERVKFTCPRGYELKGESTVYCRNNGWSPKLPSCEANKPRPSGDPGSEEPGAEPEGEAANKCIVPNSHLIAEKPEYKVNEYAFFSCPAGFKFSGTKQRRCLSHGWKLPLPTCKAQFCTIQDQQLILSPHLEKYKFGNSVAFSCPENLVRVGDGESTCTKEGWNPELPTCKDANPDQPEPTTDSQSPDKPTESPDGQGSLNPDSRQKCPSVSPPPGFQIITLKNDYYSGEKVEIQCSPGYVLHGDPSLYCVGGRWEFTAQCIQKQRCRDPRGIENGEITKDTLKAEYVTGDIVKYSCYPGYSLIGSNENKCTGGTWLAPPQCTANSCGAPRGVDNGLLVGANTNYNHGESAKYTCNKGYKLTEESPAKCLKGDWTDVPECISTSCPPPPSIDNGRLIPYLKNEYASGEKVQYTCNQGYNLEKRKNEATCEDTKWKSIPVCRKTGASCSTPPTVKFGDHLGPNQPNYRSGFQIKYKCPSYFKLLGLETVTCKDGVWDEPPVCLEPCTANENEMRKNNIIFRWSDANKLYTEHEQFVEFICIEGYEIADRSLLRLQCNRGVILYPKCNRIGSCLLSEETMKQQNIYLNRSSAIQNGEKVLFECNKGMVPENTLEGTCKMRILNYPKCIISQKCKSVPDVPNGRVKNEELKEDGYDSGSSVEFECDENHKLSGPINVKCENGQWSDLPQCLKPCRISLEELSKKNVELKSQDDDKKVFKDSESVGVKCKTGYKSPIFGIDAKGDCYNGKMKYPRCFRNSTCRIEQENIDEYSLELDAIHNDDVYYEDQEDVHFICKNGFRSLTGSLIGKCEKKILHYPKCIPEQSCPVEQGKLEENNLQLGANQKDRFYFEAGASVTFICRPGFKIASARSLQTKCEKQTLTYPRCSKETSV